VVGRAVDPPATAHDPPHGRRERRARGVKPGHVEQAGAVRWGCSGALQARERERRMLALGTEQRVAFVMRDQRESENALVEVDAPRNIADCESHGADPQGGVDRRELRFHRRRGY